LSEFVNSATQTAPIAQPEKALHSKKRPKKHQAALPFAEEHL
jgi:hypothetical protein